MTAVMSGKQIQNNMKGLVIAVCGLLIIGCASPNATQQRFPIPEPATTAFAYEIELSKLNQFLAQELPTEQHAELLYRRGALHDALGLRTLARIDFNHALEYNPRLAGAYNYLGIHYTVLGEYSLAYEALDSVLELEPEHGYARLNRGIAAYYDGRHDLAAEDMQQYWQQEQDDPYRILWLYLAEHQVDPANAMTQLAARREQADDAEWAVKIIDVLLGKTSMQSVLNSDLQDDPDNPEQVTERLCEAYFYFGKMLQHQQRFEQANIFFRLALSTNVLEFVEHRYASVELARTRQQAAEANEAAQDQGQ